MRIVSTALAGLLITVAAYAQTPVTQTPVTQTPAGQAPAQPAPGPAPVTQVPPAPGAPVGVVPPTATPVAPVAPLLPRSFTATTGLLFNTVRPERVLDFETVIGHLKAAMDTSTDPGVRAQAQGWRVFKATEPGPNATILYVFVIDPAIPGADYGLGRLLADAYPEKIQEIWKLYQGSVTGGGSLLNLMPVEAPPPTLVAPESPVAAPGSPVAAPLSPVAAPLPPVAPTAPVLAP